MSDVCQVRSTVDYLLPPSSESGPARRGAPAGLFEPLRQFDAGREAIVSQDSRFSPRFFTWWLVASLLVAARRCKAGSSNVAQPSLHCMRPHSQLRDVS